ncbi:MAG: zinc metalloprotease HtpX [Endomicrobiaceae bacterium]|nr:zinc metalloprotease HtpX [Endomicrobiaceae bacterium]
MNTNSLKTFFLLLLMTVLFLVIGELIGGVQGMQIALIFAILTNFISYFFSDSIVLTMYKAKPVSSQQDPRLHSIVSELAMSAKIPMPKIYKINTNMPNAFATGRNPQHASVAVTEGILRILDDRELRGVLAHELSHIKNRDILISCIAATLAGAIMLLVRIGFWFGGGRNSRNNSNIIIALLLLILAPIAAGLIQMAISRSREYIADSDGAKISGDPLALASALRKLAYGNSKQENNVSTNTAHMFIVNPLKGKDLQSLFATHPPIEDRIKRLEQMANIVSNDKKYDIPKVIY